MHRLTPDPLHSPASSAVKPPAPPNPRQWAFDRRKFFTMTYPSSSAEAAFAEWLGGGGWGADIFDACTYNNARGDAAIKALLTDLVCGERRCGGEGSYCRLTKGLTGRLSSPTAATARCFVLPTCTSSGAPSQDSNTNSNIPPPANAITPSEYSRGRSLLTHHRAVASDARRAADAGTERRPKAARVWAFQTAGATAATTEQAVGARFHLLTMLSSAMKCSIYSVCAQLMTPPQ
jgi:hypothetical protein